MVRRAVITCEKVTFQRNNYSNVEELVFITFAGLLRKTEHILKLYKADIPKHSYLQRDYTEVKWRAYGLFYTKNYAVYGIEM